MANKLHCSIAGRFKLQVRRPDGSVKELLDWQDNLITNLGMDSLGGNTAFGPFLQVGSGTSPPAVTDTTLGSKVAHASTSPSVSMQYPRAICTYTANFGTGAAAGILTELGLSSNTTGDLRTRAQFVDSGGAPTSVTVLPDEQLIVTYVITQTFSVADAVSTVTDPITGVVYTCTARPWKMAAGTVVNTQVSSMGLGTSPIQVFSTNFMGLRYGASATLGPAGSAPSGGSDSGSLNAQGSMSAYVPGSYTTTQTMTLPITGGNYADITVFTPGVDNVSYSMAMMYKFGISPKITKTSSQTLAVSFTVTWARG